MRDTLYTFGSLAPRSDTGFAWSRVPRHLFGIRINKASTLSISRARLGFYISLRTPSRVYEAHRGFNLFSRERSSSGWSIANAATLIPPNSILLTFRASSPATLTMNFV